LIFPYLGSITVPNEPNEVTYANGRLPTRVYLSKSFPMPYGKDKGKSARYITKVFDEKPTNDGDNWDWIKEVVYTTPGGRKQLVLNVAREAGSVRKIKIQKVPTSGDLSKMEPVLDLDRDQANRLIDLIKALDSIPIEGAETVRIDDQLLRDFFSDPEAMKKVYVQNAEKFHNLIQSDADARDVIALQRRRNVVKKMREWLDNDTLFRNAADKAGGPERVWQRLLEENPWILGIGLGGQLMTSWNSDKLEQVVSGYDISGPGKRVDALLRTRGILQTLAFVEIKHHGTRLLLDEWRSGVWRPSQDLVGAVAQCQQTVHMAVNKLGDYISDHANDGARKDTGTYIIQPRSFVIIGSADQLKGEGGGLIDNKVHSFEMYRRNLLQPEVLTFDELVARAEWHVRLAEGQINGLDL
jgi:hypothetical protein